MILMTSSSWRDHIVLGKIEMERYRESREIESEVFMSNNGITQQVSEQYAIAITPASSVLPNRL